MRLPVAVALIVALAVPASAEAGTVALEGTELVFRGDATEEWVTTFPETKAVPFHMQTGSIAAGPGCTAESGETARCRLAGVTALRFVMGDGDDTVVAGGRLPLFVDLGPGDDELGAGAQLRTITASGGPGDDRLEASPSGSATLLGEAGRDVVSLGPGYSAPGPFVVDGGPDDDELGVDVRRPGTSIAGGDGNDRILVLGDNGPPVAITCGPGTDHWIGGIQDQPGDGCAPHLAGVTPRAVSRAFREGSLTGPASGSVTLRRRVRDQGRAREIIARGTFTAQPGALRVSLGPTAIGRRWLRREPRLTVRVYVRTSHMGERGEVGFDSRIR